MKKKVFMLIIALASFNIAIAGGAKCWPGIIVDVEFPYSCVCSCDNRAHFWVVAYGQAAKMKCLDGLWYRADLAICDWPLDCPDLK